MKPYRATPDDPDHHSFVTEMFDRVAPRYDRLNRIMTLGLDVWWRRQLVRSLDGASHRRVLDVCTGTGDVALALRQKGHEVVGLDAAPAMLALAREKGDGLSVRWCRGNCLALPFADEAFDAATMCFGIRNIADRTGALRELRRVVRPGGCLLVMEVLTPRSGLWGRLVERYEGWMVPVLGAVFARQRPAYEYFARSIAGFGTAREFERELAQSGWMPLESRRLTGGAVLLFRAT